jgi:hypothetical protein
MELSRPITVKTFRTI